MKAILIIDVDDKFLGKEISLIKFADGNAICCSEKLKPLPQRINSFNVDANDLFDFGYMYGRNELINELEGNDNE